ERRSPASTTSTMMQRSPLLPALLSAAALAASAAWPISAHMQDAPADPQFEQARQRFHGAWRRSTPDARAQQVVDAAIEQTVGAMNFFLRGVARGQLRDNTPLNGRIDLLFGQGGRITVMFD